MPSITRRLKGRLLARVAVGGAPVVGLDVGETFDQQKKVTKLILCEPFSVRLPCRSWSRTSTDSDDGKAVELEAAQVEELARGAIAWVAVGHRLRMTLRDGARRGWP